MTYTKLAFKNEDTIISGRGGRTKIDTPQKAVGGKLGAIVRTPTRFLNAEDEFFKQIQYRTHLERWAFDRAVKAGKSRTKIVFFRIFSFFFAFFRIFQGFLGFFLGFF